MTVPVNNVSLLDLQNEFGGDGIISLSEYYAGGPYVSNPPPTSAYQTAPIPTNGTISLGCFRGVTKITPVVLTPPSQVDMVDHSNGPYAYRPIFTAGGGEPATNILFLLTASGGRPAQDAGAQYIWSWQLKPGYTNYYSSTGIYQPNHFTGSEITATPQANNSIKSFFIGAANSGFSVYIVTVTDGVTSASIELGFDAWW